MSAVPSRSELDRLIGPEIRGDAFAGWLARVAATAGVRHVLEIGSSSGDGSTAALVEGAARNPDGPPTLHCLELSEVRFGALAETYRDVPFVRCYLACSVGPEGMPARAEVEAWARARSALARLRLPDGELLRWYDQDVAYLKREGVRFGGIGWARAEAGIDHFDAVLIDGSEFTGSAELDQVYGARFLMLDDIRTFKNAANHRRLLADPAYRLLARARWLRNGFAVFERVHP